MKFVISTTILLGCLLLTTTANFVSDHILFESKEDSSLYEAHYITHREFCMERFFHDETYCFIIKIRWFAVAKKDLLPVAVVINKYDTIQDISKLNNKYLIVTVHIRTDNGIFAPSEKETIRALKWIRDNIHTYDGDKSKVTLCYYPEDTLTAIKMKEYLKENLFYKVVTMNSLSRNKISNVEPEIKHEEKIDSKVLTNAVDYDLY